MLPVLIVAVFAKHTTALSLGEPGSISVCTNRACRKAGSHDTLRLLRSLASTAARCDMFDDGLSVGQTEPGLEISDDAVKASVHRLYAERAMRAGNLDEA